MLVYSSYDATASSPNHRWRASTALDGHPAPALGDQATLVRYRAALRSGSDCACPSAHTAQPHRRPSSAPSTCSQRLPHCPHRPLPRPVHRLPTGQQNTPSQPADHRRCPAHLPPGSAIASLVVAIILILPDTLLPQILNKNHNNVVPIGREFVGWVRKSPVEVVLCQPLPGKTGASICAAYDDDHISGPHRVIREWLRTRRISPDRVRCWPPSPLS